MPDKGTCRSCGAPIIWARSATTGGFMPLDAAPAPDGNTIIKDGMAHVMRGDLFEEMVDGPRYKSHFATCPSAKEHRKLKMRERSS